MARASPIIFSTNAGELSATLDGRVDISKYASGCKRLENFLPLVQGPAVRRGGSRFVHAVKNEADRTWLIKFEYSATQCFYLEFGDIYVRFYTDHGILESAPNVPYEIVSPYALADLTSPDGSCALRFVQSGDVLYIANKYRTYAPRKLTRIANTNWAFSTYAPQNGPFLPEPRSATMQASATTGAVTLTASGNVFAATDVGRLVRIEVVEFTITPWETAKAYGIGNLVRFDGKTYRAINAATSGTVPPTHEVGKAYDGKTGVQWEYVDSGYGVVLITAYTDPTSVDGTVVQDPDSGLNELPFEATLVATSNWALGAWSATTEYPSAVAFFRNRLWWAGQLRLWGSVPDDFDNMAPDFFNEVQADNAISRIVTGQDVNDIDWIVGADKLVIGTGGGEFACSELSTSEPLGPANFAVIPQSQKRVHGVAPLSVGNSLLYLQRAGRKLLGLNFAIDIDRYQSTDLTVLSERIARSGLVQMAYQSEPYSIVWAARANGLLVGFTYEQEQQVTGFHKHPLGGSGVVVESVAAGPTPDGDRDELWMIVKRTINGATHRYVEFMERPWEGDDADGTAGDDQEDAFYVDSGLTYDGAATTTITGLGHLEGETVQILADGARQTDKVVTGGEITLDDAASVVQAGLQYVSRLVPMRLEAGSQDGTAQGKMKRIHKVVIRFFETLGGKCGRYGETLDELSLRSPSTPMGSPEPIASGDSEVDFPGDYDLDAFIEIVQDAPLPMTVTAIMPQLRTNG